MEKDCQTRVFLCGGSATTSAWVVYPPEERTDFSSRLQGEAAEEVLRHVDIVSGSIQIRIREAGGRLGPVVVAKWGCRIPGEERFFLDCMDVAEEERYHDLATRLEERTGKTGLTIVIY